MSFSARNAKLSHRGIGSLFTISFIVFLGVAIGMTATIMTSGFLSGDKVKDVFVEALDITQYGLQIVGKISATVDLSNYDIMTTATPITVATGGSVNVAGDGLKLNYKLIKVDSHTITYDNIYVGTLSGISYSSVYDAVEDAKTLGLIDVNPYVDEEKPDTTSAFIYWIVNINGDERIDQGELAVIAVIYAEKDRPTTSEYIKIEGIISEGKILTIERNIPNISSSVIDLGGKI